MTSKDLSRLELLQGLSRSRINALPLLNKDSDTEHPLSLVPRRSTTVDEKVVQHDATSERPSGWGGEAILDDNKSKPTTESISNNYASSMLNTTPEGVLQRGHLAPSNQTFCSLYKLSKLLDLKVVDEALFSGARAGFFAPGKFWSRQWHLYYVWPMTTVNPIIIIAECQFKDFMNRILHSFSDSDILSHPRLEFLSETKMQKYRDVDLSIDFPDHPRFTPRYLGLSHNMAEYDALLRQVPSKDFRMMAEPAEEPLDEDDITTFNAIARGQVNSGPNGFDVAKAARDKAEYVAKKKQAKKDAQAAKKRAMNDMFKRSQQYLGMRPEGEITTAALPKIDPASPTPYPPSQPTVLICFDVESWERNHNIITEVGLAIFSSTHLSSTPAPGATASAWHKLIEAHHFRIAEHSMYRNTEFIQGNPYGFKFGESQEVSVSDCSLIIEEMFDFFAADAKIVLVGHAVKGDIQYLDRLGFNPGNHAAVIDTLDTQGLWKALNAHAQGADNVGLARLLVELDLDYGGLHNAGNDAVYTMRAFLAMLVLEGTLRTGV